MDKDNDKIIYKQNICMDTNIELIKLSKKHKLRFMLHTHDTLYCSGKRLTLMWKMLLKLTRNENIKIKYLSSSMKIHDMICKNEKDIIKFEIISLNDKKLKLFRKELKDIKEIEVASSSKKNVEVTTKGVSKGNALKFLCEYFNIKKEEVMAIGDSENDISMLQYAGFGVAMGNAIDTVKKEAEFITETNDNDGVAKAIEEYVINL